MRTTMSKDDRENAENSTISMNMENTKAIFATILMMDFFVDFSNNFHVCY